MSILIPINILTSKIYVREQKSDYVYIHLQDCDYYNWIIDIYKYIINVDDDDINILPIKNIKKSLDELSNVYDERAIKSEIQRKSFPAPTSGDFVSQLSFPARDTVILTTPPYIKLLKKDYNKISEYLINKNNINPNFIKILKIKAVLNNNNKYNIIILNDFIKNNNNKLTYVKTLILENIEEKNAIKYVNIKNNKIKKINEYILSNNIEKYNNTEDNIYKDIYNYASLYYATSGDTIFKIIKP